MNEINYFLKVRDFAVNNSQKDDIHGFMHVERVYRMCLAIGKELNANLDVLKIAALLHDIGRLKEKTSMEKRNHADLSAELASEFLKNRAFNISEKDFNNIIHMIRTHSFSNNIKPETLEAKILSDADKLDAMGAIGIYRTIGFTIKNEGGLNDVIKHLEEKILKLKDLLYLDYSKNIAQNRHQFVVNFYNKLLDEK